MLTPTLLLLMWDDATTAATASNLVYIPSNYVICDRSGFKIRPEDLRTEWNGAKVRKQDFEGRNAQDFVRSRPEKRNPSPAPESHDVFITTAVTANDL